MKNRKYQSPETRRAFLKHTGILAAAAPMIAHSKHAAHAANTTFTDVVDCHIHFWAADKKKFPYSPNPPYAPENGSTADQWEVERVGAGIAKGIFVIGAPYGTDHSFLFHTLKLAPDSLGGVCIIDPNVLEGVGLLEKMVNEHNIVGVRLQTSWLWGMDWGSKHLDAFWKKIGDLDIVCQMHLEPEHTFEFEKMLKKYPGTHVVIDHLGRPRGGDAVNYMNLLETSEYPQVYMKMSAFSEESREAFPHDNLRPLLKEIVRKFSPDRLVWGGNYSGGMGSDAYAGSIQETAQILNFLSTEELRKMFVVNPRKLYKF